ncbi:MAG: NADH-quinone oxidoreductase subunit J [Candidatus Dichloromethanomonas elyunquensis]|nr:MAG: NADH-quinone oxidoreductase subunit J [Candidatus Dichloromethanomonas elyunquensis]
MTFAVMFYVIAIITLGSALMMVTSTNIFHSALLMLVSFLGIAAVFVLLQADFLAAAQVLVYAGAITVFVIFGIMFTMKGDARKTNRFSKNAIPAAVLSLILIVINAAMVLKTQWPVSSHAPLEETVSSVAELMLTKYVVAFEVTAVLLLIAMIGAIVIVKEVKKPS